MLIMLGGFLVVMELISLVMALLSPVIALINRSIWLHPYFAILDKGKATNTKEYVRESILCPGCYVVFNEEAGESYPDGLMPTTFSQQLSVKALDKLVNFISQTEPPAGG